MNKFQHTRYNSINDFLDFLPEKERLIVEDLRNIVFETIPEISEKLSYNVPYYSLRKRICFIWPSSVPWGKVAKDGVSLGFVSGNLITDPFNILKSEGRKSVRSVTFFNPADIDPEQIRFLLFEAVEIHTKN